MTCIDTTVLIDEFCARGNPEIAVNRTLLRADVPGLDVLGY